MSCMTFILSIACICVRHHLPSEPRESPPQLKADPPHASLQESLCRAWTDSPVLAVRSSNAIAIAIAIVNISSLISHIQSGSQSSETKVLKLH